MSSLTAIETWWLVLPVAERLGLVTEDLADPDALLSLWREEAAAAGAVVMMPQMITAWSRMPGAA
ncbi:hypothetical protein [Mycobacterium sp.]|uniref:hypothetical protein n=1 Tax=Mycobacterium sp. TaxID=1785 RepID=UPI002CD4D127|nr:hypothetical protein [Mycobacterium sp.]HTQ16138.1 hypothetical protein [Mycobacterium sp.]